MGLDPQTLQATYREVALCRRNGVLINTFMLAECALTVVEQRQTLRMSLGLSSLFRRLAATPILRVAVGYVLCMTLALLGRDASVKFGFPFVLWLSGLLAVVAQSALFTMVALYRDDDLLAASVLITAVTALGGVTAFALELFVQTGSLGPAIMFGITAPFNYLIKAVVLVPLFAVLVWIARALRRWLAPDTMGSQNGAA